MLFIFVCNILKQFYLWQIPAQGRVCYACWVRSRRNVQRARNIDEVRESAVPAHRHHNVSCALCGVSLFRRQTHALPSAGLPKLIYTMTPYRICYFTCDAPGPVTPFANNAIQQLALFLLFQRF